MTKKLLTAIYNFFVLADFFVQKQLYACFLVILKSLKTILHIVQFHKKFTLKLTFSPFKSDGGLLRCKCTGRPVPFNFTHYKMLNNNQYSV